MKSRKRPSHGRRLFTQQITDVGGQEAIRPIDRIILDGNGRILGCDRTQQLDGGGSNPPPVPTSGIRNRAATTGAETDRLAFEIKWISGFDITIKHGSVAAGLQQLPLKHQCASSGLTGTATAFHRRDQCIEHLGMWIVVRQHPMNQIHHVERHSIAQQIMPQGTMHILQMPGRQQCQITARLQQGDDLPLRQRVESTREGPVGTLGPLGESPKDAMLPGQQTDRLGRL